MKVSSRKHLVAIVLFFVLVGGIGGMLVFGKAKNAQYETARVVRQDIIQEVNVTGRVQSAESVGLAFEKAGRIAFLGAKVGERVAPGALLVRLDSAELLANLAEAKANVQAEQAKLQELERGTRLEELQVQRVKVQNAETALSDSRQQVVDTLQDGYTRADDAVRNKVDQAFLSPKSDSPQILFITLDPQLEATVETGRVALETMLSAWKTSLGSLNPQSDLNAAIAKAKQDLAAIKSFLDNFALAINGAASAGLVTQTTLNVWKADVSTARTNVNTAISNTNGIEESFQSLKATLALEQQNLTLKEAGASAEELATQLAKVQQAQANQGKIEAQIEKNSLHSPIAGIVTKQVGRVGELVSAGVVIVSLISDNDFEIETHVPEADIAKVKIGNASRVTLDAYGRDTEFAAEVVSIDPAETIVEGVATYKVILLFTKEDERIRSGMTANLDIATAKSKGVLGIPQRAVIRRGEERVVRVVVGKEIQEVSVQTGLRGSDGRIEIIEGLQEGDEVVTFLPGE